MKNRYGLPESEVDRVRQRDSLCVYCHKKMFNSDSCSDRRNLATIEHLNHLPPWDNPKTIAICCQSCNSSRGDKPILEWFKSEYCKEKNITPSTVADPVLDYIREFEGYNG